MNTIAYAIYLAITYLITVNVGWRFYRNGRVFILGLLDQQKTLADALYLFFRGRRLSKSKSKPITVVA